MRSGVGAVPRAVRLFGYKQAGRKIRERFRGVLDELVEDGALVREGELLQSSVRGG